MNTILEQLSKIGVVPVIALEDATDALPLGKALCEGGIPCAEVTFRTEAAEETIRIMAQAYPQMIVGAGTVLTTEQVDRTMAAGGKFIVSPGFDPEIVDYCIEKGIVVIPGLLTPSEVAQAVKRNLEVVKFFPAESFGGLKTIKAIAAPYHQMLFMPSGGINQENMKAYLEYDYIACVGGSWMVKANLIQNGDFEEIRRLSKEASEAVSQIRG